MTKWYIYWIKIYEANLWYQLEISNPYPQIKYRSFHPEECYLIIAFTHLNLNIMPFDSASQPPLHTHTCFPKIHAHTVIVQKTRKNGSFGSLEGELCIADRGRSWRQRNLHNRDSQSKAGEGGSVFSVNDNRKSNPDMLFQILKCSVLWTV